MRRNEVIVRCGAFFHLGRVNRAGIQLSIENWLDVGAALAANPGAGIVLESGAVLRHGEVEILLALGRGEDLPHRRGLKRLSRARLVVGGGRGKAIALTPEGAAIAREFLVMADRPSVLAMAEAGQ